MTPPTCPIDGHDMDCVETRASEDLFFYLCPAAGCEQTTVLTGEEEWIWA
jgi:hypothetical protein